MVVFRHRKTSSDRADEQRTIDMNELLPVALGLIFGTWLWRARRWRPVLSVLAVVLAGACASLFSGEWAVSWRFLLLDVGEAAAGLALGLAACWLSRLGPVVARR